MMETAEAVRYPNICLPFGEDKQCSVSIITEHVQNIEAVSVMYTAEFILFLVQLQQIFCIFLFLIQHWWWCEQIKRIVDRLLLSDADMDRLMTTLLREMEYGLSRDPQQRQLTSLQMENTYVRSLLDGKGLLLMMMTTVDHFINWLI